MGLAVCQNAWITRYGTLENRPGTIFDAAVKDSTRRIRLVPFVFSNAVSYLLEFGEDYIRPFRNGARIDVSGSPTWSNVAAYSVGSLVTYMGVVYRALLATTGDQPDISPTIWNPQAGGFLEIQTDIPQGALAELQYVQQSDVMTMTQQLIHPKQLLRFSDTVWQFVEFTPVSGISPPLGVAVTAGFPSTTIDPPTGVNATGGNPSGINGTHYIVTAYADSPSRESADSSTFILVGFRPTSGSPVTVTWNPVSGAVGYAVYRSGTTVGDVAGIIAVTDDTTYVDKDSTSDINGANAIKSHPAGTGGGTLFTYVVTSISNSTGEESPPSDPASASGATPSTAHPNVITWNAAADAASYRIYKNANGVFGFIGTSATTTFNDDNIIADTSIQPPTSIQLFSAPDDYPAVCGFYQQRLCFANTLNQPQTVWMSRVGVYSSFTVSTPVADDDAIQFTIAGKQVQEIRALVDLGKLVVHTSNAEYICTGNQAGTITPSSIGLVANGSAGAALIAPVIIGNTDLFIQQSATRILDLRYNVQSFSYDGKDLTKFAPDLFQGRTIIDMAWQKLPHSMVWLVLDNGTIIALTYIREDEMWAWHEHVSSNGHFENVCVVPEGDRQTLYTCVRRTISGVTKRYIEQFASRACLDTVFFSDAIFADSSLTYDGRNQGATTITATTGAGWTPLDLITLTASASAFAAGIVGDQIVFEQYDDDGLVSDIVSFQITGRTSDTVVTGNALREVPTWARATPVVTWGTAVTEFSGIGHLEGQALSILADGNVAANPLNDDYPVVTVTAGSFTLEDPALVVTAGLPLEMQVQTLPLENAQGTTIINHRITVRRCTPIFHNSRGGNFGQDFDHLTTWKQPTPAPMGYPVAGITGPSSVTLNGTPSLTGQVCIQLDDPVPFGMSGVVMSGELGDAT